MNTRGLSDEVVLVHSLLAWDLWLCIAFVYLFLAVPLICYCLFSRRSLLAGLGESSMRPADRGSAQLRDTADVTVLLAATLARRDIARRALTIRVLGYIMVPVISVIPGVILDILSRTQQAPEPKVVIIITSIASGLMGTFNATLFSIDPSVLAVIYSLRAQRQSSIYSTDSTHHQSHKAQVLYRNGNRAVLDQSKTSTMTPLRGVLVTTVRFETTDHDNGMEYEGHFATPDPPLSGQSSILSYDTNELADTYDGL
jgi:hypothetical protein